MRRTTLNILLAASLGVAAPVHAESDIGKVAVGIAQSLIAQEQDKNAYLAAQRSNSVSGYQNYLGNFPKGAFRVNAEQALAKLGAAVTPTETPPIVGANQSAASVEATVGLSRSQRVQVQKQLTALGYSTGGADGLWGSNTRKAIGQWQTANKLSSTGYVTDRQVRLIAQQAGSNVAADTGATVAGDDPVEERLLGLTNAERREVQRRLTSLGYNVGVDGVFGPNTRRVLASWQRDEGLRASGYLTADQLRSLRRDTGG